MEKRLELERRGRNPDQIKELNLDNARSASIVGLTDEYVNLEVLSLINVGLTSVKGFPNLPKLKKLELSDNRISGNLNYLSGCPNLKVLTLCGNKISDYEALEPLKDFKHLETLDLFSNDITTTENYREKVFNLIPSLKYLDGFDQMDKEAEDKDASEQDEASGSEEDDDEEGDDFNEDEMDDDDDDDDQAVDEELDEEDDEASDSDEGEEEVGLSALIDDINEESDNEENFEPETTNGDHASDSDIDSDDDEKDLSDLQENRGLKRKHEGEQENE